MLVCKLGLENVPLHIKMHSTAKPTQISITPADGNYGNVVFDTKQMFLSTINLIF